MIYREFYRRLLLPALFIGLWLSASIVQAQICDIPEVGSLPTYQSGTAVTVQMIPAENADLTEVCYFDQADGIIRGCYNPDKLLSQAVDTTAVVFENLLDGHTYGFFAKAYCPDLADTSFSDTVFTTLDNSPPDSVKFDSTGAGPVRARASYGGVVSVDWLGAVDAISGVVEYELQRKIGSNDWSVIDTVSDTSPDNTYLYQETLAGDVGLIEGVTTFYEMIAIDAVGNRRGGRATAGVMPDSSAPPTPTLTVGYDYDNGSTRFIKGLNIEMTGASNAVAPAEKADSIRFEIARDSLKYFTTGDSAWSFFTTGWITYTPSSISRTLSMLPPDHDSAYVNGHTYYVRCKAKDKLGHESDWSDALSVVMDPFPPGDISNLAVTPNPYIEGVDSAAMLVTWDAAFEAVSGLDWYYVYRSTTAGNWGAPVDSVPGDQVVYRDYYWDVDGLVRTRYYYRILSKDKAGNYRTTTSWTGDDFPHLPPELISLSCDTIVDGRCYRGQSTFWAYWNVLNDTTNAARYNLQWNGNDVAIDDLTTDDIEIDTEEDSSRVRVRIQTVFNDSTRSRWSADQMVTIWAVDPPQLADLTVTNQHATESYLGNIYVNWEKPDRPDIYAYHIFRRNTPDVWLSVTTQSAVPFDSSDYTDHYDAGPLTTYEWYVYCVVPVNWVGREAPLKLPIDSAFCNRAPVIDSTITGADSIKIFWTRPTPNLAESWGNRIEITYLREDADPEVWLDSNYMRSFYTLPNLSAVNDTGRYVFRVQEYEREADLIENATDSIMETAWSQPCTVPYMTLPASPQALTTVPQPLDPDLIGTSAASIYVSWDFVRPSLIDSFRVSRTGLDTTITADDLQTSYGFMDSGLNEGVDYRYTVRAIDKFSQPGNAVETTARVQPIWAYTPQVVPISPRYFNASSLTFRWYWLDENYAPAQNFTYGADSVVIQVSLWPGFDALPMLETRAAALDTPLTVNLGPTGVNNDNNMLYFRIRGIDRFGHQSASLWSTDYFTDTVSAFLDARPPEAVTNLSLDSSRAVITPDEDSIAVYLTWPQVADRGGSGLQHYNIYRTDPDRSEFHLYAITEDTVFIDGVRVGNASNCDYNYRIQAVDSVGNEQTVDNNEVCLEVLTCPSVLSDSLSVSSRKLTVFWHHNDALPADSFRLEAASHPNHFSLGIPEEAGNFGVVPGTDTSFTFPNAWDPSITTVYYRIKAIRGINESGWTDSAWTIATDVTENENTPIPTTWTLDQNYPNPFNPVTDIPFGLPSRCHVNLTVYNILGMTVTCLVDEELPAGNYIATWDGTNTEGCQVASGIYFYRLEYGLGAINKKMVLIR
ncbi:MAG TPA: T9SS type A sorting domain-containing protein [candidate division Zixibacteria bacterium]|nr:T9SS type A sorting domain-containing protein [candidate division Zixibacteria bacterium]